MTAQIKFIKDQVRKDSIKEDLDALMAAGIIVAWKVNGNGICIMPFRAAETIKIDFSILK